MDTLMKDASHSARALHHTKSYQVKEEKDLYMRMKELESELEILQIQEEYLKDEQRHLKSEYIRSKEEIKRI